MKRVFIIHGWEDSPHNGWFPWIKKELQRQGIEVHAPLMPDPAWPKIDTWVPFLQRLVGPVDTETYFIGHSIGGQAVLRYFQGLPAGQQVGGVVLVGAWVTLKPEATADDDAAAVADPWLNRPLDWPLIRSHVKKVTAIMSDDDQFVPLDDKEVFRRELGARIVIERQKRHMSGADGVMVLPSALTAINDQLASGGFQEVNYS